MLFRHFYDDCITSIVVLKAERYITNGHMIPEPYFLLRFTKFQKPTHFADMQFELHETYDRSIVK